jgi:hypothetical protein
VAAAHHQARGTATVKVEGIDQAQLLQQPGGLGKGGPGATPGPFQGHQPQEGAIAAHHGAQARAHFQPWPQHQRAALAAFRLRRAPRPHPHGFRNNASAQELQRLV